VIWYLLITSILNVGQSAIERYYARGTSRSGSATKRRQVSREETTIPIVNAPSQTHKEER